MDGNTKLRRRTKHEPIRERIQRSGRGTVVAHKLTRALHVHSGMCLEVHLEGEQRRWQPACTVEEEMLAAQEASMEHDQRRFLEAANDRASSQASWRRGACAQATHTQFM